MPAENFSPDTGSFITLSTAEDMVADWVSNFGPASNSNPKATAFGSNKIQDILDQSGCVGLRIYNGYDDANRKLVIVGVDEDGNDLTGGYILDVGSPCPPMCAPTTSIN